MADMVNVELDEGFLKKFFGLTDRMIPEGQTITPAMLRKQLDEIETEMKNMSSAAGSEYSTPKTQSSGFGSDNKVTDGFDDSSTYNDDGFNLAKKSILIIDDLGVITYQLGVMFKKLNFNVSDSKEIYDAIEKFKKQEYDLVIMDLFIPTEREGFILLEELKKTAQNKKKPVKIGVMSASAKKEHKQLCKVKGAEFYIEKADDWQQELIGVVRGLT